MNKEDIIRMAREAGAVFPADGSYHTFEFDGSLERFAELVAAAERKACAHMCDEFGLSHIGVALMFRGKHGD